MSHFFAYLSRMKFIERWGLMRCTYPENVQEHSLRVAMIAHSLAVIRNRLFGGKLNPDRAATLAMFHDATEVVTGDMPAPIKYFNPEIRKAYKRIETHAERQLVSMIPADIRADYLPLLEPDPEDDHTVLVKAADKICAYIKCLEELSTGNKEFERARESLRTMIEEMNLPEISYFLDTFMPSIGLTLDELGDRQQQ